MTFFYNVVTTDLHYLPGLSARGQKVSALVLTYDRSSRRRKLLHTNFCYCLWANYIFQFVKKVLYVYFGQVKTRQDFIIPFFCTVVRHKIATDQNL